MTKLQNTASATGPLTEVAAWRILDGRVAEFEDWCDEVAATARDQPGHVGVDIIPPSDGEGEYVVVFRFETYAHLRAWQASDARRRVLKRAELFREGRPSNAMNSDLEFCFAPAGSAAPPPRWKMAIVTVVAVWPASLLVPWLLRSLIGNLPSYLRALVVAMGIVILVTWVLLPVLSRVLKFWLSGAHG